MLEVVFSDSACGGLKYAQHYGEGPYRPGCIGVIFSREDGEPTPAEIEAAQHWEEKAEEAERLAWERAVPLGGSPADVLGISLNLSAGDISEEVPGPKRRAALLEQFGFVSQEEMEADVEKLMAQANHALERVLAGSARGEDIRVWYSQAPDELCGLYWLMERLEAAGTCRGQVLAVRLPQPDYNKNGDAVTYRGWGEVPPGEWHRFTAQAAPIPPLLRRACSHCWQHLRWENAPLRACLNGILSSVPEDFYDGFLRRSMDREADEFDESRVLGRTLGALPGVGDGFLAGRIQAMVDAGALEVLTPAPADGARYWRRLRKTARFRP